MKLFDFIKIFFGDNSKYYKLKKYDKAKNRFMINRFMSINYPIQAQFLNLKGIDPAHVVDSWHLVAKNYKKVPSWIYTKTKKIENKNETFVPQEETVNFYINKFKISRKDYETCLKFNKEELYQELEKLEKEINSNKNI